MIEDTRFKTKMICLNEIDFVFEITIEIIKQKSSSKSKSNKKTEEPMGAIRFSKKKKTVYPQCFV